MTAAVFTHPACTTHDPGPGHPEQPARLTVLLGALEQAGIPAGNAAPGDTAAITPVHPADYVATLEALSNAGGGPLTPDTAMNASTWPAILGAIGAVSAAVDHALGGGNAFAAVRPPGHHALEREAMGFCFVNNVVVAARRAQAGSAERVLIVDWDVHHGNGTQALVERDPTVRFVSLHQWPWYPGTGAESERGVGNVFNVPRPPGLPAQRYVNDLWQAVKQAIDGWQPDMVFVSAGFDAMAGDPLGGFTLEAPDYADVTERMRTALPGVPIVGLLEGGYIPERIAEGALAHIQALA
jgi:acetoin utilization deacetylase AcuC-like enzyme